MTEQEPASDADATEAEPDATSADADATTDDAADEQATADADESLDDVAADVDAETLAYVQETPDEDLAAELASLRVDVEGLEATIEEKDDRIDDLESRLKRTQADFQNYKKRMQRRREEEKQRATEALIERLLDVRDNLLRALDHEGDDLKDGVESTLRQFDQVLDTENVAPIEPEAGDDVDPHRHEVLARVDSDYPGGTIADVHRPGYEMAEKVLRPAQVAVSEPDDD